MGRKRTTWTDERLARLERLRKVDELSWSEIGARMGIGWSSCQWAFKKYCHKSMAERAPVADPDLPISGGLAVPDRTPADWALPAPVPASGKARRISPVGIEILARVAEQGITAGVLGDPLPGRSALDKRRAGAS